MTTLGPLAALKAAPAGEGPPRRPCGDAASRGRADAALLVVRLGGELAVLATMADDIQRTVGAHIDAAALVDPELMRQAQALDLLTQTLRGLSSFLTGIRHQEIGHEALDFEGAASAIGVGQLGDRLAGRSAAVSADDVEFF